MPKRIIANIIEGRPAVTVTADITVRAAAQLMAQKRIGAVMVVDGRRLTGIFTERDILNKIVATGRDPEQTRVADVMVGHLQTISPNRPLAHALLLMADGGFRHVPVVDDEDVPLGMVSARDALGADLVELEQDMRRMEELENSIGY